MSEGIVPEDWRIANVTPIYKKGGKAKVGNYRPVSLTAIICKLMEGLVKDSLFLHLLNNNLLIESQHGFMQRKSCLTNLIEYLDELTRLVDEGHSVDVVYLDFSSLRRSTRYRMCACWLRWRQWVPVGWCFSGSRHG